VFGLSRDDAGTFLPANVEAGIQEKDPFVSIDVECVGLDYVSCSAHWVPVAPLAAARAVFGGEGDRIA
jgi:hypothetical protein